MTKQLVTEELRPTVEQRQTRRNVELVTVFRDLAYTRAEIEAAEEAWERAFNEGR